MANSYPLLKFYLQGIRRVSGAVSASLCVPSPASMLTQSFLVHDGRSGGVPELSSMPRATSFLVSVMRGEYEVCHRRGDDSVVDMHEVHFLSKQPRTAVFPLLVGQDEFSLPKFSDDGHLDYVGDERRDADPAIQKWAFHKAPAWLGLEFPEDVDMDEALLAAIDARSVDARGWLNAFAGALGRHLVRTDTVLHDSLTGLPGPAELVQVLSEFIVRPQSKTDGFALLMFCPEDCGEVKDRFSENISNSVLAQVAQYLGLGMRSTDFLSRAGSATFAVALPGTTEHHAVMVAKRLMQDVSNNVELEDLLPLILKCGITFYNGEYNASPTALIQQATLALHKAMKRSDKDLARYAEENLLTEHAVDSYHATLTGVIDRDHRRMVMANDLLSALTMEPGSEAVFKHVSLCMQRCFGVHDSIFVRGGCGSEPVIVARMLLASEKDEFLENPENLSEAELSVLGHACEEGAPLACEVRGLPDAHDDVLQPTLFLPLSDGKSCTGALVMRGPIGLPWIDLNDVVCLSGVARSLGAIIGS